MMFSPERLLRASWVCVVVVYSNTPKCISGLGSEPGWFFPSWATPFHSVRISMRNAPASQRTHNRVLSSLSTMTPASIFDSTCSDSKFIAAAVCFGKVLMYDACVTATFECRKICWIVKSSTPRSCRLVANPRLKLCQPAQTGSNGLRSKSCPLASCSALLALAARFHVSPSFVSKLLRGAA